MEINLGELHLGTAAHIKKEWKCLFPKYISIR